MSIARFSPTSQTTARSATVSILQGQQNRSKYPFLTLAILTQYPPTASIVLTPAPSGVCRSLHKRNRVNNYTGKVLYIRGTLYTILFDRWQSRGTTFLFNDTARSTWPGTSLYGYFFTIYRMRQLRACPYVIGSCLCLGSKRGAQTTTPRSSSLIGHRLVSNSTWT